VAAHCANAGIPVLLFDQTIELARAGLERALRASPASFFVPAAARLVTPLAEDDLPLDH
jgi:3-hydroxyacyl-CoA dehydrogenase